MFIYVKDFPKVMVLVPDLTIKKLSINHRTKKATIDTVDAGGANPKTYKLTDDDDSSFAAMVSASAAAIAGTKKVDVDPGTDDMLNDLILKG